MSDRPRTLLPASLLLALAACSSSPSTLPDSGAPDTGANADAAAPADTGEAPDAGAPDTGPPPDTGAADECARNANNRCDMIAWTSTTGTYPVPVDHHGTLVTRAQDGSPFLIAIGGIRSTPQGGASEVYTAVRRAPINADGTLGPFDDDTPLDAPRAFHGQVIHNGFVYLLAGISADALGPAAATSYSYAPIEPDGSLRTWVTGMLPREVRIHPTAEVLDGKIYLIGGTGAQGAVLDSVIVAEIGPDGAPGMFTRTATLPAPRSHHASVVAHGHIYVLGGFDANQTAQRDILRSVHDVDGKLTGWESIGELTETPWTSSAIVHRGWLVLVGGGEGDGPNAHFVDRVRAAPFMEGGMLGAFEDVDARLPRARSHVHQTPVHEGRIYSIGGRVQGTFGLNSYDGVYVGQLW